MEAIRHRPGPCLSVVIGLLWVLGATACGGSSKPVVTQHWAYQDVTFSYPGTLAPGSLTLATASAQTGCLCHTVIPPSGDALKELHSESFLYNGDSHSGVAIKVIDTTNDSADVGTATDGVISGSAAASLASQLGLPVDPQSIAPYPAKQVVVGGQPATYLAAGKVTSGSGPTVSEETWLVLRSEQQRLYVLTCQYTDSHRNAVTKACQAIVDSLAVK